MSIRTYKDLKHQDILPVLEWVNKKLKYSIPDVTRYDSNRRWLFKLQGLDFDFSVSGAKYHSNKYVSNDYTNLLNRYNHQIHLMHIEFSPPNSTLLYFRSTITCNNAYNYNIDYRTRKKALKYMLEWINHYGDSGSSNIDWYLNPKKLPMVFHIKQWYDRMFNQIELEN